MNLRDFEYIVAISELGSFSRAAKSCNVSQPSLSTQVKKLEEELGLEIFARTRRKVTLTPSGGQVIEIAKQILELQLELEQIGEEAQEKLTGKIRIGAILTVAPYIFPAIVTYAKKHEPKLNLLIKEGKTEELFSDLIEGRIDAAIVSLPTESSVFESHSLFHDQFLLAVSKKNPLIKTKKFNLSSIDGERLILLEEGHCFRDQALSVCNEFHAKENSAYKATSFETIRGLVAAGEGITLMPKIAKREGDGISYLEVAERRFSREIGIIWKKNSKQKQALIRLKELVLEALTKSKKI